MGPNLLFLEGSKGRSLGVELNVGSGQQSPPWTASRRSPTSTAANFPSCLPSPESAPPFRSDHSGVLRESTATASGSPRGTSSYSRISAAPPPSALQSSRRAAAYRLPPRQIGRYNQTDGLDRTIGLWWIAYLFDIIINS
uniref:DUF3778 domain-containing protein n=1 Tax=Oryza barthii TaxID=65489 RepID=A0A0D3FD22_9ORYZ